jgi:hypothetical protein
MSTIYRSRRSPRQCARPRLFHFALLALLPPASAAAAEGAAAAWRLEPGFDVRMVSYYLYEGGQAAVTYPALGARLDLELSSATRPYAAGLFADYEVATREEKSGNLFAGGWVRYRYGGWEASSSAVHFASRRTADKWLYSGKLQYRLRPGHKVALEAIGMIGAGGDPAVQLAYDTNLSERLSLTLSVGLGPSWLPDFGIRSKFVWKLR